MLSGSQQASFACLFLSLSLHLHLSLNLSRFVSTLCSVSRVELMDDNEAEIFPHCQEMTCCVPTELLSQLTPLTFALLSRPDCVQDVSIYLPAVSLMHKCVTNRSRGIPSELAGFESSKRRSAESSNLPEHNNELNPAPNEAILTADIVQHKAKQLNRPYLRAIVPSTSPI